MLKFNEGKIEKSEENFKKLTLIGVICNIAATAPKNREEKQTGNPL